MFLRIIMLSLRIKCTKILVKLFTKFCAVGCFLNPSSVLCFQPSNDGIYLFQQVPNHCSCEKQDMYSLLNITASLPLITNIVLQKKVSSHGDKLQPNF